jgi:hypothetical protein
MELLYLRRQLFPVATSSSGPSGQPIALLLHKVEAVLSREFIGMPHGASAYVSLGEPHITCMCGLSHNESKFATNKKFSVGPCMSEAHTLAPGATNKAVPHLRLLQARNPAKMFGCCDSFLLQTTTYVAEVRCSPLNAVLKASSCQGTGMSTVSQDTLVGCLKLTSRLSSISKYLGPHNRYLHRLLFFGTDNYLVVYKLHLDPDLRGLSFSCLNRIF